MQNYTLTVLVNEKVSEADRNGIFDGLKKNFNSLVKEDLWGIRSLAYDIKHANKAFYGHFEFEATPEAVITLDKNIRLNEDIIRYLIVKVKTKKSKVKSTRKESKVSEASNESKVDEETESARNASQSDAGGEEVESEAKIETKEKGKAKK